MPRVVWNIDGNTRPLERKLDQLDRRSERTGRRFANLGGSRGLGGGGQRGGGIGGVVAGGFGGSALLAGGAIAATGAAVAGLAKLGGELETATIQFQTFLGSAERGNQLLAELNQFANFTPFSNQQVIAAGRTLLAFGFSAEQVQPTLRTLGDISAGTGKDLRELSVIFGQIRGAGRLMGQDLLQLVNAGFNPLQVISQQTGRSMGDLRKDMEKGLIGFDRVEEAFKIATSEGGLFFNLTSRLAASFEGRLSTALGKGRFLLQQLGVKILPMVNKGLDLAISAVNALGEADFNNLLAPFRELRALGQEVFGALDNLLGISDSLGSNYDSLSRIINTFALQIRAATLPIRFFLRLSSLLIETGKDIISVFQGVGNVVGGALTRDFGQIREGVLQAGRAILDVRKQLGAELSEFAKNEAAQNRRIVQGLFVPSARPSDDIVFGQIRRGGNQTEQAQAGQASQAATTNRRAIGTGISGGRNLRNFTINIDKLIGEIIFERWDGQSEAQLQNQIVRTITTAVNNSQRLAGN